MSNQHAFSVSKPISGWNKPLKINYRSLFIALGKAVTQCAVGAGTANPVAIGNAIKEVMTAFSSFEKVSLTDFVEEPGQIGWVLIHRSLLGAMEALMVDHADLFTETPDPEAFAETLDLTLEETEVQIDESLFSRPKELPILEAFQTLFADWLQGFGLDEAQANAIADRLPTYFVFALHHEWARRPGDYAGLKTALIDSPFMEASAREEAWRQYRALLQKQVDERMFDEAFSLRQVYVPLRAYYEEKEKADALDEEAMALSHRGKADKKKVVVPLAETLNDWLQQADPKDAIRIISGGPGCGKSSFTKMWAADIAADGAIPVLHVPLHHLGLSDDLEEAIGDFVRDADILPTNPLHADEGEPRLLIIFDGLDELAMQGRVGADAAQKFMREVQKKVSLLNLQKIRMQALMSGRELVVQANATEFRKTQQILHILPYFLSEQERKQYADQQELLAQDQREMWWQKYGKASGEGFTSMPEALRKDNLNEITAQPLLNYLVALSLSRGKIDFSTETNLNAIYQDLLEAIYERGWERRPHLATQGLEPDDFFRILEEIALATWHGDGRTTTIRNIENHCKHSGLKPLLENFQEGAKAGVTRLLTAFYFRQSGLSESGDKTFEFTHKSFGEYLTARRIIRAARRIHDNLEKRKAHYEEGWDESKCLEEWVKLCGPSVMDDYLFSFVTNEVCLQENDMVAAWQQTLSYLISFMLRNGIPMERLNPRPSYHEESRQARNAEESLLATLNACARITQRTSHIAWPSSNTDLGTWLRKLQPQRSGHEKSLVLNCLSYLDMSNQRLDFHALQGANLQGANLQEANLQRVNFQGSNLYGATLQGAIY